MKDEKIKSPETQKEVQKKETLRDYETRLEAVLEMKKMTDTDAWKDFYADLQDAKNNRKESILIAEKTRDILRDQEAIKIINKIILRIQKPIEDLNAYCNAMPLFRQSFHTNATFNKALGIIEINKAE